MKALPHPDKGDIDLPQVLDALSDPTRLAIVTRLADGAEMRCGSFLNLGSKTNLTYHLTRLREAGLVNVRIEGTLRYVTLRSADLDTRFPGLLDSVVRAARASLSEDVGLSDDLVSAS